MRVVPEIFWEEEMPQSKRLNFMDIKFGASKACIDEVTLDQSRASVMNISIAAASVEINSQFYRRYD